MLISSLKKRQYNESNSSLIKLFFFCKTTKQVKIISHTINKSQLNDYVKLNMLFQTSPNAPGVIRASIWAELNLVVNTSPSGRKRDISNKP